MKRLQIMAKQLEDPKPTHEEIAQRAYALFETKGRVPGHEIEHWLEAESQLIAARKSKTESRSNSNGSARSASRQNLSPRS